MLDPVDLLNLTLMLAATVAPIIVAYRVRGKSTRLLALAMLLAAFTFIHSLYHLMLYLGLDYVAAIFFWPLGAILLLGFGVYYWKVGV